MALYLIYFKMLFAANIAGGNYAMLDGEKISSFITLNHMNCRSVAKVFSIATTTVSNFTLTKTLTATCEGQKMGETTSSDGNEMDSNVLAIISQFKTQINNRLEPAKKLLPLLKNDTSIKKVETILGAPTSIVWDYTLFYSSTLIIYFDNKGKLKKVSSDILDESISVEAYAKDHNSPDVIEAISKFKQEPYNRQNPAKILLPLIKAGMSISKVAAMLGPADGKLWVYDLMQSSTLSVRFSKEDTVEKVSLSSFDTEMDIQVQ